MEDLKLLLPHHKEESKVKKIKNILVGNQARTIAD